MISDVKDFCKLFYASTFFPVTYYSASHKIVCAYPKLSHSININEKALPALLRTTKNPDYYISKFFGYYGIIRINHGDGFILAGPVFSTPLKAGTLKSFMHESAISMEQETDVSQFFQEVPNVSFNQFLSTLIYIHYCINDQKLNYVTHFNIADNTPQKKISIQHSNQIYDAKEDHIFHNTYLLEQQYLSYIQSGEPEKLKNMLLENASSIKEGIIADNALRQSKNIFITAATLATRSAITGGLDIEQAYQLSDVYINESEKMQSTDSLANLQFTMIIDFAERVSQNKIPQGMSKEIFECVQYISRHTNETIRVNDIAAHIGRSRSYISKKFKSELGLELNAFIMSCKLKEAKGLLTFTDKSLSEISNYLCFSSQAYFQNVFKKKYGMTPMQYRNQTMK